MNARFSWQRFGGRGVMGVARLGLLALLLMTALLRAPAISVSAGSPSLTASENPLVIPVGQSSKSFTVAWNSGNGGPIELYGTLNGGPEFGPYPGPATGSSTDSLNFGDTWTIKMYTPGKKELLATLTVTTKRPDQAPSGPCAEQCIRSVDVDPHGTFANFHIVTTAPVKVILEAYEAGQSQTASATFNLGQNPDWKTYLLNLKPNTKYTYNIKATDANGNTKSSSGSFKTLHRQVTVNFTTIHVIDDSDDLSAGDFIFWFNTNGAWDTFIQFPTNGEISVSSGQSVNANYTKIVIDTPDSTKIAVYGWDDDCDFFDGLCTSGIGPGGADHGSTSEADWATASGSIDVTTSGLGEVQTSSFSITTNQWKVKFTVTGTYTVDYVP